MKTRIISGIAMVPLLLVVYFGGIPLMIAAFLVASIGCKELYSGFEALDVRPSLIIGEISACILFLFGFFFPKNYMMVMFWLVISVMASCFYLFNIKERKIVDTLATILGIVYVIFFSYHVVLVDQDAKFHNFIWIVLISAFGSDIFAYFTGVFLGKHKLCPNLSPKKTIEGAIGGFCGSGILCGLFAYFVMPEYLIHAVILGFIASIFSMCGDLTASAFKRQMGIKDYGNLIPGHGGIMDRFDSVLFTAPVVFYYITLVIQR